MLSKSARLLPVLACAAALAGAASSARADVHWIVSGEFDDGGDLSGYFNINVYGFLDGYDLTTTAGSSVSPGVEYTPDNSYFSNGAFILNAQPGYKGDLHLVFLDDLGTPVAVNPLAVTPVDPPVPPLAYPFPYSYECVNSFSCFDLKGGTTRYLAVGAARGAVLTAENIRMVPEPATWTLMIAGFGLAGAMLRRRRALAAA